LRKLGYYHLIYPHKCDYLREFSRATAILLKVNDDSSLISANMQICGLSANTISYLLSDEDSKIISQAGCEGLLHESTWNCYWFIFRSNIDASNILHSNFWETNASIVYCIVLITIPLPVFRPDTSYGSFSFTCILLNQWQPIFLILIFKFKISALRGAYI